MSGVAAVIEVDSKRVGLQVLGFEKSPLVIWGPGQKPEIFKNRTANGSLTVVVPVNSFRFLQYAAVEHLEKIWKESPADVLLLLLSEKPETGRSAKDLCEVLRSQPHPLIEVKDEVPKRVRGNTDDAPKEKDPCRSEILKQLKDLVKLGVAESVKMPATETTNFRVVGNQLVSLVPEERSWLLDQHSNTRELPSLPAIVSKSSSTPATPSPEEYPPEPLTKVGALRAQLLGKKPPLPEGFEDWLADPLIASRELLNDFSTSGELSILKAKKEHLPVIALLGPEHSSTKEEVGAFYKAFNSSVVGLLSLNNSQAMFEMKWFSKALDSACESLAASLPSHTCIEVLTAALNTLKHTGAESKPSQVFRHHILTNKSFDRKFKIEEKANPGLLSRKIIDLAIGLPFDAQRIEFGLKIMTGFGVDIEFSELLQGAELKDLELALNLAFHIENIDRSSLLTSVDLLLGEVLRKPTNSGAIFRILELVEKYGLEVEPKAFGTALKRSLQASPKTRNLVAGLSNDEQLAATEFELSELRKQVEIATLQVEELTSISANDKAQIARLTSLATESRKEHEESILSDIRSAKIPVIKAMARALSASIELLDSKPSAISRLEMIAEQVNLFTIGKPGEEVEFSKALHEDPEGSLEIGSEGVVHNVGFRWQDDGKEVIVLRAVVTSK
ncbi:MAG: hypothetical protein K9G13_03645 [Aquiluna sp.]|nr:hypothetical protein [Aquiluna sp.]MCF8545613.1 hypothetical protein [Aquiluna sp.]